MQVPNNTLYPHINNDIKYGLFKDVIIAIIQTAKLKKILIVTKNVIPTHNIHNKSNN